MGSSSSVPGNGRVGNISCPNASPAHPAGRLAAIVTVEDVCRNSRRVVIGPPTPH